MKANEAPEKIFLHPDIGGREFIRPWLKRRANQESVEYIRTDAFIEKVYNWLKNYAFVDDNKNINLPILLHDFLKDSRSF